MDLDTIVFGNFSLREILIAAGVLIVVVIVISLLKKLFSGKKEDIHVEMVTCRKCGWSGRVSRYAGVCPGCGSPLGRRLAKKE